VIYALTLGTFIIFVMRRVLGITPDLSTAALSNILMSIGAGVHEELVFRLGAFAGGAALLRLVGMRHPAAMWCAVIVSSALFSAAHHVGAAGEPWVFDVFVFRLLAGLLFAAIFYYRSLAHATYTHALYDVYVLVIR
jgi:membrane protease YdiL (CAAX protease family)